MIKNEWIVAQRRQLVAGIAFSLLIASGSGCSQGPEADMEQNTGSAERALGTTEVGCFDWAQVDTTLTGGGEFVSPATYGPANCFQGYRLNLVDYNERKYNGGAVVGYAGPIPTTEATCTGSLVRAYVWIRESNGTMTFVQNKNVNGKWLTGLDGTARCLTASVNLERDIGIVPNGARDYRVAMTARNSGAQTVPIAFATVEDHLVTPLDNIANLRTFLTSLGQHSGSNLQLFTQALWNKRSTAAGQIACRWLDVDRGLHGFTRTALIKAGGTASAVDARITALNNFRAALCTAGGTTANLHSAVTAYVTQTLAIRDQVASGLLAAMPAIDASARSELAANLVAQVTEQGLGALISKCDLNALPLDRFLLHGTLPSGVTDATRVVLGSCGGQTPAQAASGIGFGTATPGVANPLSAMADCMAGLAAGVTEDRCSSPLTQGAPAADNAPAADESTPCVNRETGQACNSTLQDRVTALENEIGAMKQREQARAAEATAQSATAASTAALEAAKNRAKEQAAGVALEFGLIAQMATVSAARPQISVATAEDVIVAAVAGTISALAGAAASGYSDLLLDWFSDAEAHPEVRQTVDVRQWCESHPGNGEWCDKGGGGNNYCPADPSVIANGLGRMANLTWFETGGSASRRQATKQDLFNHCMCAMVDSDYSAITRGEPPARAPARACPQTEARRKLECVADPRLKLGDDGKPDPKCPSLLSPGTLDANTWRAKDCELKLCPANQKPFSKPNGNCDCQIVLPVNGQFPNCSLTPRASSGMCTADAAAPCFCEPIFPKPPNGGDPFCRQDPTVLPGPLSSWIRPDTDALRLDVFNATTDVIRMRAAGDTQFVSSSIFPNSHAVRGTSARQKVVVYKTPLADQKVDLKAFYTNRTKGVVRQPLGTCNMGSLAVGVLSNCDFPLPTIGGTNAGNLEDRFELEFELDSSIGYTSRPGLGPTGFTGTAITTPSAKLAPLCTAPTPSNGFGVINITNPLPIVLNQGLSPNPTYPLPNGLLLRIPLGRPVVRQFF